MILSFQETPVPSRPFDPDIVWQVFSQLVARLMAHLPYLILGVVVFALFLVAGLDKTEGVLNEPAPSIFVAELGPSSLNFNIFFWTNSHQATVLTVIDGAMTGIKLALDKAGIDIPYPHTVVLTQPSATPRDGASPENY